MVDGGHVELHSNVVTILGFRFGWAVSIGHGLAFRGRKGRPRSSGMYNLKDVPYGGEDPPQQKGPGPYRPHTAQLGLMPTPDPDTAVCAVLLLLFAMGAATHMTIFQMNRHRNSKSIFPAVIFGFCMARVVALTMRIAWATHSENIRLAIAANIFTAAGVLLLFDINLIFAHRLVRAYHPWFGWHKSLTVIFRLLLASVIIVLIMVISATVQSFYTLNQSIRQRDRNIQLFSGTFLATVAFLPVIIVTSTVLWPRETRVEKFGQGSLNAKIFILLFASLLLSIGAGFRVGTAYAPLRPIQNPAWYHSKACYYIFNYGIELIVVFTYAILRVDRRFHVPEGSSGPGHYAAGQRYSRVPLIASSASFYGGGLGSSSTITFAVPYSKRASVWTRNLSFVNAKRGCFVSRSSAYYGLVDPIPLDHNNPPLGSHGSAGEFSSPLNLVYGSQASMAVMHEEDRLWMERAMRELYTQERPQSLASIK